jgi:hypothetical protein
MARKIKSLSDLFKDKDGKTVIMQMPNPALGAWLLFLVLGNLLHSANLKWLSTVFLFTWAFMELYRGASYFRRFLGLAILAYIVLSRFLG